MADEPIWDFSKGYRIASAVVQGLRGHFPPYTHLLNLLPVRKMANITSNLLGRRSKSSNGVGDNEVDLTGVGLSGHIVAGGEAELLAEKLVQLVALLRVPVEQLEERSLCTSGTLGATELEFTANLLDAVKIKHQVLGPLGGTLSNCNKLSCLKMSVCESWLS